MAFERAFKGGDLRGILNNNRLFHQKIVETCGNGIISEIIDQLRNRSHVWYHYIVSNPARQEDSIKDHKAMIECLVKGDSETLKVINEQHLTRGYKSYSEDLRVL